GHHPGTARQVPHRRPRARGAVPRQPAQRRQLGRRSAPRADDLRAHRRDGAPPGAHPRPARDPRRVALRHQGHGQRRHRRRQEGPRDRPSRQRGQERPRLLHRRGDRDRVLRAAQGGRRARRGRAGHRRGGGDPARGAGHARPARDDVGPRRAALPAGRGRHAL
ncbi:MAG: hypothetical protein AVDCRST_MAG13-1202, partial [uncultured Solirubrobacteraceae bacterium]